MGVSREQWRSRTSWNEVCARSAGRRRFNEQRRRFVNQVIDELVWPRLMRYGLDKWGTCSRIAREIGVHRSTVCRYRQRIFRELLGR
jgi:hypothetical protein